MKDRFQRYRYRHAMREFLAETVLLPRQLIMPVFIATETRGLDSLPQQWQYTPEAVAELAQVLYHDGIRSVLLFGIPDTRDDTGAMAADANGLIPRAIRAIHNAVPDMIVIADLCLCQYTTHGACACLTIAGNIDMTSTHRALETIAIAYAEAGADAIAPSGMIDGTVPRLRQVLDRYQQPLLIAYAMKYHSALYGPFRDATVCYQPPGAYSRAQHQLPPTQQREALRDALYDADTGADSLIVKPAGFYLDQITRLRDQTAVPIIAYQVSGEYTLLRNAGQAIITESLIAIKRAGADFIITYFAHEWAKLLNQTRQT